MPSAMSRLVALSLFALSFTAAREVFDMELMEFAQVSSIQSESATVQAVRKEVRRRHKLGLVFVTQPWCGACDRLKRSMNEDDSPLHALLQEFVIFNHEGDNVKQWQRAPLHNPSKNDTYVPRVYFLDMDGEFLNQHGPSERHPYFYKDAMALLKSVVGVLEGNKKDEIGMLQLDEKEDVVIDGVAAADSQDGSLDAAKVDVTVATDALRSAPGSGVQAASFGILTIGIFAFVVILFMVGGVQSVRENPRFRTKFPKPMRSY